MKLSRQQARRFLLVKHGLIGQHRFSGKQGALQFIRGAGCVQFDPVDVCGRNAELVLCARVKGFTKQMLAQLLYEDRALVDYFDKNLAILPVEDWPYFERFRAAHRDWERSRAEIDAVRAQVRRIIAERGPTCSQELDMPEKVSWYWSETKLSRAALEHMYFAGELAVHHKKGNVKYYDLIERCVPMKILQQPEPYPDEREHRKWRVLRRVGGVGLLWNRASDAWLGIGGLRAAERQAIFAELLREGRLVEAQVEGLRDALYLRAEDLPLAEECLREEALKKRCEFIAPLDNMLWDRSLIRALFDFDYKWEIYTPGSERKYGHYVLPILYGDGFAGRIEMACDRRRGALLVKNIWWEGDRANARVRMAAERRIERFAAFHDLGAVEYENGGVPRS